jgi:hypothetical protein
MTTARTPERFGDDPFARLFSGTVAELASSLPWRRRRGP